MAEILGAVERLTDSRTITQREHTNERRLNRMPEVVPPDLSADSFISAAGITNPTEDAAIRVLVSDLKAAELWTPLHAIYPFVGGSGGSHKFNLKDPRDLDAAFRLTYIGGPTHSATGMLPSLAGAYADTHFVPADHLDPDSITMAYYSRTDTSAGDKTEMGNYNWGGTGRRAHLLIKYSGDNFYYGMSESGATSVSTPDANSQGLFASSRVSSVLQTPYKNGTPLSPSSAGGISHATNSSWIGGINTYTSWTDRECAFACIGDGLYDDQHADLYTVVQNFQTALSRNV